MSNLHCDYCGEHEPENKFLECDLRPYDIFCSKDCINNHINDIESGEWSNHDNNLKKYYANDIKNNWQDLHIEAVTQ
jgi:hypothetical protein